MQHAGVLEQYNSKASPYLLVPLSKDYKLSTGALNSSSNLVSTINCVQGGGTTSYANAIEAAQAELDAHGRAGVQDVIVFLSDGAANLGPTYYATSVSVPDAAVPSGSDVVRSTRRRSGTIVYSIGYALADDTGGCTRTPGAAEKPAITVTQALQDIATSPADFYNQPTPGS